MFMSFLSNIKVRYEGPTATPQLCLQYWLRNASKRGAVNTTNKVLLTVFTLLFIFLITSTLQNLSLFVSLYFLTELFLFSILLHYSPSLFH